MAQNDVYRYHPAEHHCHEGIAVENEHGVLVDTFWGIGDWSGRKVGRDAEDLELIGNLDNYELSPRNGIEGVADYAPADRLVITSQHGHRRTHYIRIGAKPDLATKIENARRSLADAESALRSAEGRVVWARKDLEALEAERDA